jgi:hypothetical protein
MQENGDGNTFAGFLPKLNRISGVSLLGWSHWSEWSQCSAKVKHLGILPILPLLNFSAAIIRVYSSKFGAVWTCTAPGPIQGIGFANPT